VTKEKSIEIVKSVLQRFSALQINLASESAQIDLARAIIDELEASAPGVMRLEEVAAADPYPYDSRGAF